MKTWHNTIKKQWLLLILLSLAMGTSIASGNECTETYGNSSEIMKLATGSTGELGLLKVLAAEFNKKHGTGLCWMKAGAGASLKLLKEKKV
jgi:tungstate transport system substrate-binding protein